MLQFQNANLNVCYQQFHLVDTTQDCTFHNNEQTLLYKLHLDQNVKLVHYGVTYVLARDGYSGKIVAAAMMSRKNTMIIYEQVYRAAVLEYGLWDQLRVDYGREFYLVRKASTLPGVVIFP